MKALNGCIPLVTTQLRDEKLVPTRYWELYTVTDTISLLLHLLTGAVDLLNRDETHVLRQMFESGRIIELPDGLKPF